MAEEYFAKFEINFILTDLRLRKLTPTQRWIYVCLWTYAVQERLETVWMPDGNVSIASVCHVDGRCIPSALAQMQHLCLIEWDGKEWLTVCGVKNKHRKLKWKDSGQIKFDDGQGDTPEARDIDIDIDKEEEIDDTVEEIPFDEIIQDLNKLINRNFKSKTCEKLIKARWSEGHRFKEFQIVHRKKALAWLGNDEMKIYLRPSTLYRQSHFDEYLNEAINDKAALAMDENGVTYKFNESQRKRIKEMLAELKELVK